MTSIGVARAFRFSTSWRRYLRFNAVGALGFGVQLTALALLTGWAGLHYLLATACAVELAVLHNFAWHERWTWSDRTARDRAGLPARLLRFHLANGVLSLAGNLLLMALLVGLGRMNYLAANLLTIGACSIVNFLASEFLVFTGHS